VCTNAFVVLDIDVTAVLEAMTEDFKEFDFVSKSSSTPYNPHQQPV